MQNTEISLVPYDRRFLLKSREWFADAELSRLTATPPVKPEAQEQWFSSLPRPNYHIWGVLYSGQPVAVFGLKNVTHKEGEYWGYIGEKNLWGVGIGRWMMQKALEEACKFGLHRVYLHVLADNTRAISLYQRFNFREVLELRTGDLLYMVRLVEQF